MRAALPRTGRHGLLAVWVAASIVLHALILFALPRELVRDQPRVEILRVELEREEPPREQPQTRVQPPPVRETSEPPRERPKPRIEREPAPRSRLQPQPKPAEKPARATPPPATLQSEEPAQQPMPRAATVAPPHSPTAPGLGRPALELAPPQPREPAITTPPTPAASAASPQPAEPAPAPRITDARPLSAPVRYPRTAEHGRVTLRVLVNREGRVAKATLEKTSGYPNLDRHALEAVRRWRFAPARKADEAVEQWLVVNVDY